ncbi:MAG: type II toxin-antitoxin system VapC family toxin [Novosphingobium sp.]
MNRYLLDTHALIWWMMDSARLPANCRLAIENEQATVFASSVSAYEIALKHSIGKLPIGDSLLPGYERDLADVGLRELPVSTSHALKAGQLDLAHRDPFDRLLIAQALAENLTLVSSEQLFDDFGVKRLWT